MEPALPTGIVVIGRNEGERLKRCLESAARDTQAIVYVDSGSSDDSVEYAASRGIAVVELDVSRPFTAARARNAGFARLVELHPSVEFVQFVDGDCELQSGWLRTATRHLQQGGFAAVCGRRRERAPDATPYNRLADIEWDTPVGEALSFGGDVLISRRVFEEVSGYTESLIAGEDPELALRVRKAGHRITRLDREMTLHDANITTFGQWWTRTSRGGHAYAESLYLQRGDPETRSVRKLASILFWGGLVPGAALLLLWPTRGASLLLLLGWVALAARVHHREVRRGRTPRTARIYALSLVLGKVAELQGALRFTWNRLVLGRSSLLIEYKGPGRSADGL